MTFMDNFYLPPDYDKYGNEEPYEIADLNTQLTARNKLRGSLFNPEDIYMNQVLSGTPVFDQNQFLGGGMGGMAGGGGMGGGGAQMWQTPNLDYFLGGGGGDTNEGQLLARYAQRIAGGESPFMLQQELLASPEADQNKIDSFMQAINSMAQEYQGAQRQAMQPGKPTAMQDWLAETGMPSPYATYTAESLPPEMTPDTALYSGAMNTAAADFEKRAREAQKNAVYLPDIDMAEGANRLERSAVRAATPQFGAGGGTVVSSGGGSLPGPTAGMGVDERIAALAPTLSPAARLAAIARIRATAGNEAIPGGVAMAGGDGDVVQGIKNIIAGAAPYRARSGDQRVRTNLAGMQAARLRGRGVAERARAANLSGDAAKLGAQQAMAEGRTPARDALQAQMAYLRSQGLRV